MKNHSIELIGEYMPGEYENWENSHIQNIKDKRQEIATYKKYIANIEDKIQIMDFIQEQLSKHKFTVTPLEIDFSPKEITDYEKDDKIRRKEQAEIDRTKDRNPELMEATTHHLLHMIKTARVKGFYDNFSFEEIKIELSHRPNIPKGQEGKKVRRLLAQGKIQK